jgi:phosphoribosylformylglycinamidine (FGAM) synthase-like amidotransferase family enzyme
LEERYISWKTKLTVDEAIKNYKEATEEEDVKPQVVEHEDGSISISSPWASFKDDDKDHPTFLT